jgi:DMSO/TMAO reductase YedYZ heme-binding membrane subunit
VLSASKFPAFLGGAIALLILMVMVVTSFKEVMKKLGGKKWKAIQTTGYVALLLIIVHFFLVESKAGVGFDVKPLSFLVFAIAVIALLVRIITIFFKVPHNK